MRALHAVRLVIAMLWFVLPPSAHADAQDAPNALQLNLVSALGHTGDIPSVALSPDGRLILSSSHNGTVKLWDVRTTRLLRTFAGHNENNVFSVAFSPDGRQVLSGGKALNLWEAETRRLLRFFEGHQDTISSVAFTPGGRNVVSGSHDGNIKIWNTETGHLQRTLAGHSYAIQSIALSPDGRRVL